MNSREIYKQIILIENELNDLLTKEKFKFRPDLWETEKIEDMLKAFRGGESLRSIARFYECTVDAIRSRLLTKMSPEEFDRLAQQNRKESRPELWETEKIEDMLKRFRGGESLSSIARHYKTFQTTIKYILLSLGGGKMPPEEFDRLSKQNRYEFRPELWEPQNVEDMLKRFRDGESLRSIAGHYETTYNAIKRILLSKMSPEEFDRLVQQHRSERPDLREPKKIEDMLKAFRGGESIRSIAKIYHTNNDTLTRILLDPHNGNNPPMSREEYNEIIARRRMGSRIRSRPKGSRLTPEDPNADPANTYSSRATGDDPVLSGPTRDPIAEAVEEVIKLHFST